MPWLTVLRWEYKAPDSDGMPATEENQHMLMLDVAVGTMERPGFCVEVYRRIGAGLREFVFYTADRDKFLEAFNHCVADHPRYPITISFYKDEAWASLRDLIDDFRDAA